MLVLSVFRIPDFDDMCGSLDYLSVPFLCILIQDINLSNTFPQKVGILNTYGDQMTLLLSGIFWLLFQSCSCIYHTPGRT